MHFEQFLVEDQPAAGDLEFLEGEINRFNMREVGAFNGRALAIFVRKAQGEIVAGLSGYTWAGMCEVQFLWVNPAVRLQGYGRRLLQGAEHEARRRGCSTIILSTYSFQAPAFYQKQGYQEVARVEHCPPNHTSYYFQKRLPGIAENASSEVQPA